MEAAHASRWARDQIFNAAWAYDLVFSWDLSAELEILLAMARPERDALLLVPACGTGRLALALAEAGFRVEASDINASMLELARARRSHSRLSYQLADMTRAMGTTRHDCDAAFSICNSFRYVLENDEISSHLDSVAARLRAGAHYVVELALNCDDPRLIGVPNSWSVERDGYRATARWTVASLHRHKSVEIAEIQVESPDGTRHLIREEQPQRLWTWSELVAVTAKKNLEISDVRAADGGVATDPREPGRYFVALRRNTSNIR